MVNPNKHDDKTVSKIIELWKEDKTSGQIAAKLNMTRSAVMGLVGRLRSKGLLEYRDPASKKNATPDEKRNKMRSPYVQNKASKVLPPLPPVSDDISPVKLFQLTSKSCRFVINDSRSASDFLFCNKPKKVGSYCEDHHKICYIKSEPRKRDRERKPFQLNPRYSEAK